MPAGLQIECLLDSNGAYALAASSQIHQVIMSLCTNAAQALGPGEGRITLSLSPVGPDQAGLAQLHGLAPGRYLRLVVADNGPGMDQAIQERIFEPFFTTKRGQAGGLGLSVVHGIVQAHGGGIQVSSAPRQGAAFSLLLPQAETAAVLPAARLASGQKVDPLLHGSERIMAVDDDPALLTVITRLLGSLGYRVEVFSDSREALAVLCARPHDFDLLLTDQTMPGLTGDRLAAEALDLRPDLPVVVCTGFSQSLSSERARSLGISQLLMKPLSRGQLAQALRESLDRPATAGSTHNKPALN